jgi:hypothetical protein
MAAFGKTIRRRIRPGDHRLYWFLGLTLTILLRPLLAQPSPLFSRTDYALDYGISASTGLVIADLNNDGHLDFAIGAGYGIDVALGNGDGTFQRFVSFIPTGAGASAIMASVAADFDGDGNLDLVLYSTAGVFILPGKGDGTFGPARLITQTPFTAGLAQLKIADLNGDGHPDLVILINNNLPLLANATVLLNSGNGTFTSRVAFNFPTFGERRGRGHRRFQSRRSTRPCRDHDGQSRVRAAPAGGWSCVCRAGERRRFILLSDGSAGVEPGFQFHYRCGFQS